MTNRNADSQSQLGVRQFSADTKMMAGYYSHYTHSAAYKLLNEKLLPGSLIADIGAGEGAFSERLKVNGYNVVAVEKFCDFKPQDIKLYKLDLNDSWGGGISEKLDGVVGIEIIEHIENPFNFLRQIRRIVKEDGWVIISTPNVLNFESRFNLFRNGVLDMMSHPDHRTPIFPQTMAKYCKESGFEVVNRIIDIDTLSVRGSTMKGKILRTIARAVRSLFSKDSYAVGNSNIWLLKPGKANVYTPPPHA
ncbi:MAG: class I SAM-dependent methyltransferase [Chitinophagaceae bacterium]|nr:class I SAM-dependent methyltransferase [Chitinophagaceae bacterium]